MSSLNNGKNGMAYEKEIEDLKDKKSQAAYCIRSIKNAWEKKGVDWDDRNKRTKTIINRIYTKKKEDV